MRKDYLYHAIAGFLISFSAAFLIQRFWLPELMLLSVVGAMIVGFTKELIWDKWLGKGTFEWRDIYFTLFGGLLGWIIAEIII